MHSTKSRRTPKPSLAFEAIGTQWLIETDAPLSVSLQKKIHARIEMFDATYSRFRTDSLVTQAAKNTGIYVFPDDAETLFGFYEKLYAVTNGKVTPLIGGMLEKAGYDAAYSLQPRVQQKLPKLIDAMERSGHTLKINVPVTIDIGAAGKGYLVDSICELLDADGAASYVVDASGDVRHKGATVNKVGLEHPLDPTKIIGAIDVLNESICASAVNRRQWGNGLHHVFDPDEMAPTHEIIATWVIADSAMVADGIATALFFTEPAKIREHFAYEFVRMHSNGSVEYSARFEGALF